jgi:hypothetical protein
MTVPPNVLEIECVQVGGELIPLLKCPYCKFRNIHEDTIIHHIKWNDNVVHQVNIDQINKNQFFVIKQNKPESKEDLPLPWIKCLWCDYKDKVERDLEWHILETPQCKTRLYKMKVPDDEYNVESYAWSHSDIESRLARAVKLSKRKIIAK